MGKRSAFERKPRDFYPTPLEAVLPLLPHLKCRTSFDEPCCGDGALIRHLEANGHICKGSSDISPQISASVADARTITECLGDMFITNPPWDRSVLHPIIMNLSSIAPTWLLIDADWMHTKQAIPLLQRCWFIQSVGRVKWIPGSAMTGKENCAWYLFDARNEGSPMPILFRSRIAWGKPE